MYEPTLKNLTDLDYGKPPKHQNQVSYGIIFIKSHYSNMPVNIMYS